MIKGNIRNQGIDENLVNSMRHAALSWIKTKIAGGDWPEDLWHSIDGVYELNLFRSGEVNGKYNCVVRVYNSISAVGEKEAAGRFIEFKINERELKQSREK